jgi:AcrR family transcriptional regulator
MGGAVAYDRSHCPMEKPNRRERARRDKQERITQAAAQLFEATTTDQIAERADIGKGTLFLYAPTKQHLLAMVYEHDLMQLVEQAFAKVELDNPIVDTLTGIYILFYQLYEQNVDLARHFIREQLFLAPHSVETPGALEMLLQNLGELIHRWQAGGRVARDIDPDLAAQNTSALYFSVLASWLSGWLPLERRDGLLQASLTLYWRGLIIEQSE